METDEMYNSIDLNIKQPIIRKKVQHAPKIKSACVIVSFCQIQKNMVFFDILVFLSKIFEKFQEPVYTSRRLQGLV